MNVQHIFTAQEYHTGLGTQRGISFAGLVRGELRKVMWLRSTWVMLFILCSGTVAFTLFNLVIQTVPPLLQHDPVGYAYEYLFGQNLLIYRALSGFFALLVAAFSIGLEYQQGTIRVVLGRGVGRVQWLLSKMVALFFLALLVQLGGILLNGALLLIVVGASVGSLAPVCVILSQCAGVLALFWCYLVMNMWVSILLAMAVTLLGRSLAAGLSMALLWFPLDNFCVLFLPRFLETLFPADVAQRLGNVFLGADLNVLPGVLISSHITNQAFVPAVPIGGWTLVIILAYALVFLLGSLALIRSRDVV